MFLIHLLEFLMWISLIKKTYGNLYVDHYHIALCAYFKEKVSLPLGETSWHLKKRLKLRLGKIHHMPFDLLLLSASFIHRRWGNNLLTTFPNILHFSQRFLGNGESRKRVVMNRLFLPVVVIEDTVKQHTITNPKWAARRRFICTIIWKSPQFKPEHHCCLPEL